MPVDGIITALTARVTMTTMSMLTRSFPDFTYTYIPLSALLYFYRHDRLGRPMVRPDTNRLRGSKRCDNAFPRERDATVRPRIILAEHASSLSLHI